MGLGTWGENEHVASNKKVIIKNVFCCKGYGQKRLEFFVPYQKYE